MAELASEKVDPRDVDTVFLSHLHLDHVGWNTRDDNGKYVAHGQGQEKRPGHHGA